MSSARHPTATISHTSEVDPTAGGHNSKGDTVTLRGGVLKTVLTEGLPSAVRVTPHSRIRFTSRACVEELAPTTSVAKKVAAAAAPSDEDINLDDDVPELSPTDVGEGDGAKHMTNRTRLLRENELTEAWLGRGTLLEGLEIALSTMVVGEMALVMIPAARGYGSQCATFPRSCNYNLTPQSTLSFEVLLKSVTPEIDISPVPNQRLVVKHIQFIPPVTPIKGPNAAGGGGGPLRATYNAQVVLHIKQINEFTGRPDAGVDNTITIGSVASSRETDAVACSMGVGELSTVVMHDGAPRGMNGKPFLIHCKQIIPAPTIDQVLKELCGNNTWALVQQRAQRIVEEGTQLYKMVYPAPQYRKAHDKYLEAAALASESAKRRKGDVVSKWSSDMWSLVAHSYLCAGESLLHEGDYLGCIALETKSIDIALDATGNNSAAVKSHCYYVRGMAFRRVRKFDEATEDLRRILDGQRGQGQEPSELVVKELADTEEEQKCFEQQLSML